ncbi:hypothetical protein E0Z10_g5502 [Xylaria hypoxylon]|uniref:Macro domain-containing protein n=1 Tax=Xylaria hypoxylon TaxID=37992 RepID=A0A4Z0YXT8_9PEZI|nr:hypothetical protein E0Z10_g5502 [Xylaria hypoxylon]
MEIKRGHTDTEPKSPDMLNIAQDILRDTERLIEYLTLNRLQLPTHNIDSVDRPDTDEYHSFHARLVTNLESLQYLVQGPKTTMRTMLCLGEDLAALQVAFQLDFFSQVPLSGGISVASLALKVGLDEDRVCRFMRLLATHRIFIEKELGYFSHTPSSIIFQNDEDLKCTGQYILDEMYKAATESASCVQATPHQSDSKNSPFATRHGVPLFQYYEQNPVHAKRFAKAMAGWTKLDRKIDIKGGFPWSRLRGTVLDVGGGSGHVSMTLAKEFPQLRFIVQDLLPQMLAAGEGDDTPGSEMKRVSFMQHNFFEPQPVKDVSAVLVRQITHNWTDGEVVSIFKALVPTMENSKPGTPLLINDTVMPEPGKIPMHVERELRTLDMLMFVCLGAKQRTQLEFESLLQEADRRFSIQGYIYTTAPPTPPPAPLPASIPSDIRLMLRATARMAFTTADEIPTLSLLYKLKKIDPSPLGPLNDAMAVHNGQIGIIRGDITTLAVGAIVNAANKSLLGGGGVDGAIHRAAGPELVLECQTLGGCDTGCSKITDPYKLPCQKVIHTVGPVYNLLYRKRCEAALRGCYHSALQLAVQNELKTIAFSAISTGIYGYPSPAAARIACSAVKDFLDGEDGKKLDKVIFVTYEEKDANAYSQILPRFFPPSSDTPSEPENPTEEQILEAEATANQLPSVPKTDPADSEHAQKKQKQENTD